MPVALEASILCRTCRHWNATLRHLKRPGPGLRFHPVPGYEPTLAGQIPIAPRIKSTCAAPTELATFPPGGCPLFEAFLEKITLIALRPESAGGLPG